jgi:hypothetical protein
MSQLNITHLGMPPRRYRVDLVADAPLETLKESMAEDRLREKGLRLAAKKYPEQIDAAAAEALAKKLEAAGNGGKVPQTTASSVYMRGHRIKIAGALWQLIEEGEHCDANVFTVIPRTAEVSSKYLLELHPHHIINRFISALYNKGAGKSKGWTFAGLHGEYDPIGGVYRPHFHGLAVDELIKVVSKLRELPNYATKRYLADGSLNPVYRRVKVGRMPLTNLPTPVTYLLQSYWPSRPVIIKDGKRIRSRGC